MKVKWQAQSGIQLKGSPQDLTLLLKLWSTHKKGPIMTALWKILPAAERVRSRYFLFLLSLLDIFFIYIWNDNEGARESNQGAKGVGSTRCRYLHLINGQKQLTPVVELGKAERSWVERPCRRTPAVSINLNPKIPQTLDHQTGNIHQLRPPTHMQ